MTDSTPRRSLHFGSAMIDIITLVANEDIERLTLSNEGASFLLLETGRKVPAESITSHVGGGACNTAVSLARRSWQTRVHARVGDDLNAGAVREHLSRNGVEDGLITCTHATGTAVMVASHDRNASIFVHRGANEHLAPGDIPDLAGSDLVYIAPLSSGSADTYPELVRRAHEAGAMVAVNPGIRHIESRLDRFAASLAEVDLLSINRVEAEALIPAVLPALRPELVAPKPDPDMPALVTRGLRAAGVRLELLAFLEAVRGLGPRFVSLTDGTEGAYLAGPDGVWFQPALPVEVAGTAGAGDAFCSTMTAALAEGRDAATALGEAAVNAASVVAHVDTTSGLLDLAELAARLDKARATHPARRLG